jgi:hypothetical protein
METKYGTGSALSKDLEDMFFLKEDQKLIDKLRAMRKLKETKEELSKVSGIKNEAILQKLVDLAIRPETLASLSLVPLVEVAWADGAVDEDEKKAVLAAAERMDFPKGSTEYDLLLQWMTHRPQSQLLEAWMHFIEGLCEQLSKEEIKTLKDDLLGHTRAVAEASGGFLGLGNRISSAEASVLAKLETAFTKR